MSVAVISNISRVSYIRGLFYLLLTASSLSISGCVSPLAYISPDESNQDAATISSHHDRESIFTWANFYILTVDGKDAFSFVNPDAPIRISSGVHTIGLKVEHNDGIGSSGPYQGYPILTVNIAPRTDYTFNGNLDKNLVKVWLENIKTKERVSDIFSSGAAAKPMPIYVPM